MKSALLYKPKNIQIKEVDIISLRNKGLLIEVKMASIYGSDFHLYTGDRPNSYP